MSSRVLLRPITADALGDFCAFVARNVAHESAEDVLHRYRYTWPVDRPNNGFLLWRDGEIVGGLGAIYARRRIDGESRLFCNLLDWYVLPEFRNESLRLLFEALKRRDCTFTVFSAVQRVTQILRGFGFRVIDPETVMVLSAAYALAQPAVGRRVMEFEEAREKLTAPQRGWFEHLGDARCCHRILLTGGAADCAAVLRVVRRKGVRFATPVFLDPPAALRGYLGPLGRWLLRRHRTSFLLVGGRALPRRPLFSRVVEDPRPQMYLSRDLDGGRIDGLFSELTR